MATQRELEGVHDAFIIPENGKLYHFEASRSRRKAGLGAFDAPPRELKPADRGYRKAINLARLGSSHQPRGPALAVLPRKSDPATSQVCCYLVNSENLRPVNAWTAPAWSSEPTGEDRSLSGEFEKEARLLDLLVADASLRVKRLSEDGGHVDVSDVPLAFEGELLTQLRNGLVVGTVRLRNGDVVPVVNLAGLGPGSRAAGGAR